MHKVHVIYTFQNGAPVGESVLWFDIVPRIGETITLIDSNYDSAEVEVVTHIPSKNSWTPAETIVRARLN